jgi:putative transposase
MQEGLPAKPVLAAWGITTSGKPAFIGLAPGTCESFDPWKDVPQDLKERGRGPGTAAPVTQSRAEMLVLSIPGIAVSGGLLEASHEPRKSRDRCWGYLREFH